MKRGWMAVIAVGVIVGGADGWAATGKAVINGTTEGSRVSGRATLKDTPEGLRVAVKVAGVSPGFLPKDGPTKAHAGDMGNIEVNAKGSGKATIVLPGVSLMGTGGTPAAGSAAE